MAPRRTLAALVTPFLLVLAACDEGGGPGTPTEPGHPGSAEILVQVRAVGFGTADPAPPTSFSVRVTDASGTRLRQISGAFSEDPNRTFGPYEVPMPGGAVEGVVTEVEIVADEAGERRVIWSGSVSGLSLFPGERTTVGVDLYRGELALGTLPTISIEGAPGELAPGESVPLSATSGGAPVPAAWGSLDPERLAVDVDGNVTALALGEARVVVAAGPASDTVSIQVRPLVERIEISPDQMTFASLSEALQLHATVISFRGDTISTGSVDWSASPSEVVTVTSDGLARAAGNGTGQIVASFGGAAAVAEVEVAQLPVRVRVDPAHAEITASEWKRFSARVEDARGFAIRDARVEWTSSDPEILQVDSSGLARGLAPGAARLEASTAGVSGSADVQVVAGEIAAIQVLSGGGQTGQTGQRLGDPVRVRALDAAGFPVAGIELSWNAADGGSVDPPVTITGSDGEAAAWWTLGSGTGAQSLTISAGVVSASLTATAESPDPATITISPNGAILASVGDTRAFSAEVRDGGGNLLPDANIAWGTVDPAVASVDGGGVVTAVSAGTTEVIATSGSVADTVMVLVAQIPDSVHVGPDGQSIEPGETLQLSATVYDAGGTVIPGAPVTWTAVSPAVATVDVNGLVTAESEGAASFVATSGSASGQVAVGVQAPTPATLEIVSGDAQTGIAGLPLADSLAVRVLSPFGRIVPGTVVNWEPLDGGAASPSAPLTDSLGIARTAWTLGTTMGPQTIRAFIPGDTITMAGEASGASRVFDRGQESNQVIVSSDPANDFTFPDSDWTLGMWVRPDDLTPGFQYAFSAAESAFAPGVKLYLNPDLGMNWTMSVRNATSGGILPGGAPSTQGSWQYLAIRREGHTVRLWADGVEVTTFELTVDGEVAGTVAPRLGVRGDAFAEWFSGAIAHVTRWSTALTAAEIGALASGTHALDVQAGSLDWFIPLGRTPETVVGGSFSLTVVDALAGDAPPVDPPSNP